MKVVIIRKPPKEEDTTFTNEEQSTDLEDNIEIYIKEKLTKGEKWLVAATKYCLAYYMIGDIYPESWGADNELKDKIKKWYKETKEKYKILVTFYGQSRNKAKTEQICKAIESQIGCPLKENVVKILNEQGPWVAICHDLAKWLSHFLFSFSFFFSFI